MSLRQFTLCLPKRQLMLILITVGLLVGVSIQATSSEVFNTKPKLINHTLSKTPIRTEGNRINLEATVNGKTFRFILDTGSPTVLTKKVADALDLNVLGQNTGSDAHGNPVKMDLSVLDTLKIGDVVFANIPVFIFDQTSIPMADCIFDGGIIGSEIMPLTQWQINFKDKELVLGGEIKDYGFIQNAKAAKLFVFQYPHTPIIEHTINKSLTDKAIFDTGNTELLHLNIKAFEELKKRQKIKSEITQGFGSFGSSAGGEALEQVHYKINVNRLDIGKLSLKNIPVWTRSQVPTLVGARIFESQIVTLDYAEQKVYFYEYQHPQPFASDKFGLKTSIDNKRLRVSFVTKNSIAEEKGLAVGDQILAINETRFDKIEHTNLCEMAAKLTQSYRHNEWLLELAEKDGLLRLKHR